MLLAKVPNRVSQTSCQHQQHAEAKAWWAWRRCCFLIFFRCENMWELFFGASFLSVQKATLGTTDRRKQHGTWDAKLAAYCLWMLLGIPVGTSTVCFWISQVGVVTTGVGGRGRQPFYNYVMSCNCQCLPLDLEQTQQTMCGTDTGNKTSNCQLKLTWLQCRYCVAVACSCIAASMAASWKVICRLPLDGCSLRENGFSCSPVPWSTQELAIPGRKSRRFPERSTLQSQHQSTACHNCHNKCTHAMVRHDQPALYKLVSPRIGWLYQRIMAISTGHMFVHQR